jgi:hypothetical protein
MIPMTTKPESKKGPTFPLADWFDTSKPISREQAQECEAKMAFDIHKQGADPNGPDALRAYAAMHAAVDRHNAASRNW